MTGMRLPTGGRIDRSKPLTFTFDGRLYTGYQGDTLASALLAAGVRIFGRSWKYHRPRGLLAAGVEEPNALVDLFTAGRTVPNARMTEVSLVNGLVANSVNAYPSLHFDLRSVNTWFSRLMPAGFYYKTFMASQAAWHFFERHIRAASGLGRVPKEVDPDWYDKQYAHCDVLVVGAGPAGLAAAMAAGATGARVVLCDEQSEAGGWLLSSDENIEGIRASDWISQAIGRLAGMPEARVLARTTAFGYQDHNLVTLLERRGEHEIGGGSGPRERLWKVRAKQVVLATGAHERPLVFSGNDLPGVMLASATSTYIRRYAVLPGLQAVVFTNNDQAYDAAIALHLAGAHVQVVDAREATDGPSSRRATMLGIPISPRMVVTEALGGRHLKGVVLQVIDQHGRLAGRPHRVKADLLAMSGGLSPVIHLQSQSGAKALWSEADSAFLPGPSVQQERSAGACRAVDGIEAAAADGREAGTAAAEAAGFGRRVPFESQPSPERVGRLRSSCSPMWLVPHRLPISRAPKQFVDFQNDVAASDIALAVREGFHSIEHVKRYTALGFGTDQGKTGNVNGMAIVAKTLGVPIGQVGTTTFRPNYTPVTFGAIAGPELGTLFDPVRLTAAHPWHESRGALFEDVGQWKRPWYYPQPGEDMHGAVRREVLAVRNGVGMFDASTLGKIDIQGPDAAVLLNWVYTNAWTKLEVGKCRYGLMLNENGMVIDDGVTVRLAEHRYLMHTTTGGAARIMAWMERWLQTEWPHLKVYLTSVTDHWSTTAVAGPKSREVLKAVCHDVNFDDGEFPFMSYRVGTVAGIPARIMRISFSGERAYEVNVKAEHGLAAWEALFAAGKPHGITPYGTEAMHVLRAEKGFIIVGQETDGSVTPVDLGMEGLVSKAKDFIGKRSLTRSDTASKNRKQLVGLLADDPREVIPEGSQIVDAPIQRIPVTMAGHVTSSYDSPTLNRSIALALVRGGLSRKGEKVWIPLASGRNAPATIVDPVFYDPKAERQNA